MIGYLSYTEENKGWEVGVRKILGQPFLEARLGPGKRLAERFFAKRAARALARAGVRTAVFPRDYPHQEIFAKYGILPVDVLPLYRRMAPLIVRRKMSRQGLSPSTTTVAVAAERMTAEIGKLVTELALQVRYVMLTASGAEEFCQSLQREYGVSVLQNPAPRQIQRADVLLLLSPPSGGIGAENAVTLHLYDGDCVLRRNGVAFSLPPRMMGEVEENCNFSQLLAVLSGNGILQNDQIPIMEVDITGKNYYNANTVNNIE